MLTKTILYNLKSIPCRFYTQSFAESVKSDHERHIYKRFNCWKNRSEVIEKILENIIYNKGGLLIINKPYGIGLDPPVIKKISRNQVSFADEYFLTDLLPELSRAVGHPNLSVIKTCERYSSGITLLAADEKVKNKVETCLLLARNQNTITTSYYTLCLNKPKDNESEVKLAVKLEASPNEKKKLPVIIDEWSKNDVKRRGAKTILVQHKLLNYATDSSLVLIKTSRTKNNFIRLYLSTKQLSPILGDNICGSRVKIVLGVTLNIDMWSTSAFMPQQIPVEILKKLNLTKSEMSCVPTHLHLGNMIIVNYFGKNKDLQITAPLPDYFLWTCQQLDLRVPKAAVDVTDS